MAKKHSLRYAEEEELPKEQVVEEAPPPAAAKKIDPITAFLAAHGFTRSQVLTIEPLADCNMLLTAESKKVRVALDE